LAKALQETRRQLNPARWAASKEGCIMNTDSVITCLLEKVDAEAPEVALVVRRILEDFPECTKNVFIMMKFKSTPQFDEITQAIRQGLRKYGLWGIRADDKAYSDDLWLNVRAYMWACNYGVAVFEDIDERSFNPNVALEYGFMMALGRRVLLLKEERMPRLPTDITGKLWKPFSVFDIETTITQQIDLWAIDIGLSPVDANAPTYIPPIKLAPMVKLALGMELMRYVEEARRRGHYKDSLKQSEKLEDKLKRIDTEHNPTDALRQLQEVYIDIARLFRADEREVGDLRGLVEVYINH
jgi:hypothetical protein